MNHDEAHQAELERLREELDCLVVVHNSGHEGTAKVLAAHLGISKEYQQALNQTGTRHAKTQRNAPQPLPQER